MKIGLLGFPSVGKRTLFSLLTGADYDRLAARPEEEVLGMARVRDPRLDHLRRMYQPRKYTPAEIQFVLLPSVQPGKALTTAAATALRAVDAIVLVVRGFDHPGVYHVLEKVDPERDVDAILSDLMLTDLVIAEGRAARIAKDRKRGKDRRLDLEAALMKRCIGCLEEGQPLSRLDLDDEEERLMRGFQFLSLKPMVVALNGDRPDEVRRRAIEAKGLALVELNARDELDVAQIDDEDERREFLESLGIDEPAIDRLARVAFRTLGLISFFTVGPDEVRAWPIPRNTLAPAAAGKIHSDLERGFIRAEVVSYDDLVAAGSEAAAKAAGTLRLKGKDYVVQDGDILHVRFAL